MYRILFVEDDNTILFSLKQYKLWKNSEFQIAKTAENSKEALELLEKESFDLMITDIRMPMVDGLECIRRMRSRGDKTPVVLASAYTDFKYAKEGIRLGAWDFIEKPYTEKKLAEALKIAGRNLRKQIQDHENSLDLYSFVNKKKLEDIAEKLLMLDEQSGKILVSLSKELKINYREEPQKAALLLKMILEELWWHIVEKCKWITILDVPRLEIRSEMYDLDFHQGLTELTGIIERYSLNKQDKQINRICGILAANRADPAITDILERELGLTRDYISRMFRAKVGIPISQYITLLRMECAKNQLKKTDAKVYEVSEMLGYQTTDYFTRLFKSYTGYTPMQYRKLFY